MDCRALVEGRLLCQDEVYLVQERQHAALLPSTLCTFMYIVEALMIRIGPNLVKCDLSSGAVVRLQWAASLECRGNPNDCQCFPSFNA